MLLLRASADPNRWKLPVLRAVALLKASHNEPYGAVAAFRAAAKFNADLAT